MPVAFDVFDAGVEVDSGDLSWTHTPVGTPKGVLVLIVKRSHVNDITGVTYGGVDMDPVTGSPNVKSASENGACWVYFLGASIPTGAQTIIVSKSGSGTTIAGSVTLTADADTEIVDTDVTINSDSLENPSATVGADSRNVFAAIMAMTGHNSDPSDVTPLTNWTSRNEQQIGTAGKQGMWYTYDIIGTSDVTTGWTQTAEDAIGLAVTVGEVGEGGGGDYVPKGRGSRAPSVHSGANLSASTRTVGPRGESGR